MKGFHQEKNTGQRFRG